MDLEKYKHILVYGEVLDGRIADVSLELLGEACRLREKLPVGRQVVCALLGHGIKHHAEELFNHGAERVILFDNEKLSQYRPDYFGEAVAGLIQHFKPEIVLVGATATGAELAPTVAAKLKTGLAAHCVELRIDDSGQLIQVVPAFGGKVLGDIICPHTRPQMATVKAGIFQKIPGRFTHGGSIETFGCELKGFQNQLKIKSVNRVPAQGRSLHEADFIVGGGFGIGSREDWQILEELAELLNGATGCTRPALDEGWTDSEQAMIGTSGVAVRPKVYINAGISGAAHHTCGIKDAGTIISINKDPNAPIFAASNFKIVADWKKIIPLLIEKLKE